MKNATTYYLLAFFVFLLMTCEKEDASPQVDENGLTREITDLVPAEILEEMIALGMPINGGINPPVLNATYLGSPFILISSNRPGDYAGQLFSDYQVTFSGQKNNDLTIMVDYLSGPESGTGIGSFIVGEGCKFSVFVEINSFHTGGTTAKFVHVISGSLVNNGIEDMYFANFMIDNNGNSQGIWIENGEGRIIHDQDGFSPISGLNEQWYSRLPDCPCEYNENLDGKEEMCGEWEDFTEGCNGFWAYLGDYHYGATYEIRWAKDEESPGQQCTYDSEKKLITGGLAAGTPDKFGVIDPCNFNSDHNAIDVGPWEGNLSCIAYLAEWKSNNGGCNQQNIINGIDHLIVMIGTMNCERVTALFKTVANSQVASSELKAYMKGELIYTPTNLRGALEEVFNENNCSANLDELACSALQEAIENL
jgi:hypothetical protein